MAVIKCVNRDYSNENPFFRNNNVDAYMMNYICNIQKTYGNIAARNVMCSSPLEMAMQFQTVRDLFHKNSGRLLRHIVISFKPYEAGIEDAMTIAYVCASFFRGYQVVYAVHSSTIHLHIHFLVNTVSFVDGHKYSGGYADLRGLIDYANMAISGIGFEEKSLLEKNA